ncbi:MAG: helix-turn-helix domain-containing protein [Clostridia bacterium]|nr:helix-turn-helix domain-containing protein [Clostridia bacterium]
MIRLKVARQRANLNQSELAKTVGVSRSTIAMWESGASQPDIEMILQLSHVLDISVGELLGEETDSPLPDPTWINVLGRVAAGIPIEAIEEVIDREQISEAMARNGTYIGLQIHGSSMEPRMREGDIVIVRLQDDCDSGDTVIAMVNGDEATCKILQKTREGISLLSTNPAYSPMFFSNHDIETLPVRIIGKVVELRAKF